MCISGLKKHIISEFTLHWLNLIRHIFTLSTERNTFTEEELDIVFATLFPNFEQMGDCHDEPAVAAGEQFKSVAMC